MKNLKFDEKGLISVVVQDIHNGMVRMLGYMNNEAYEKTILSNYVHFYSRKRKQLWKKGETSGNYLRVKKILHDCDSDALLILVEAEGPTCHAGTDSCFGREVWMAEVAYLHDLENVIISRWNDNNNDASYTQKLKQSGISFVARKVGEEAVETIVEAMKGERNRFLEETADLIYHLTVLMKQMNCDWSDVCRVLKSR